jgi:DNA-binding PadR family transcriptional regulator
MTSGIYAQAQMGKQMLGRTYSYQGNRISHLQILLMGILKDRSMYGYEIMKLLKVHFADLWEPKSGSIYPALRKLEAHGLVCVNKINDLDHYSLSDEGKVWVHEMLHSFVMDVSIQLTHLHIILDAVENKEHSGNPMDIYNHLLIALFEPLYGGNDIGKEDKIRIYRAAIEELNSRLEKLEKSL